MIDHLPVFSIIDYSINRKKVQGCMVTRKLDDDALSLFQQRLDQESWDFVYAATDVDKAYDHFINIITTVYDECCPDRNVVIKHEKWTNHGLLKV